ncbi:MAG: aldo/keto reductase [Chloroflexaceae bacterium]|jgi:aryl-alcohol dehydrogenase-like predicted oxidoreductase|nr:aldo/keto reductase [Chloroflexaceae bacterium]
MRYKLLGHSGLRVSELCLGTMTFGDDWGWGADAATSQQMFERFAAAGGNFIDTANNYTIGSSERIVGDCIRAERDRYVVATKYTLRLESGNPHDMNLGGNSRKSMLRSVEASLRRLNTDYIDLLYLHMWDFTTPVDEVLQAVTQLIASGKVLYFAFSDTPAWVVSYAIAKAESHGWSRPIAMQVPYSVLSRDAERDILPMARSHDLALLAWGVLSGGALTGKYSQPDDTPRREASVSEREAAAGAAVAAVARELGRTPAQVAIAWVRQQGSNVIPILGCRSLAQLEDNLGCLDVHLEQQHMAQLNEIAGFTVGFPLRFLHSAHVRNLIFGEGFALLDNHRSV